MKTLFIFILNTFLLLPVYGKYDCEYLKKYCDKSNPNHGDEWGDFYCGDFNSGYEALYKGNKIVFGKNREVYINGVKIGETNNRNNEHILHMGEDILLLESNAHEEVGSYGNIYTLDIKKKSLKKIGKSYPLYKYYLEIEKDKIVYRNRMHCWEYIISAKKLKNYSEDECKARYNSAKNKHKTLKAKYLGEKDKFGKFIPNGIRPDEINCDKLKIQHGSYKWVK